jgi:hypothetical protein
VLRIFITIKIPSPWPGSNPQTLGPVASILTTTPPRRLFSHTPHHVFVSDKVAAQRTTSGSTTGCNFKFRGVRYRNQEALVKCISGLQKSLAEERVQEA